MQYTYSSHKITFPASSTPVQILGNRCDRVGIVFFGAGSGAIYLSPLATATFDQTFFLMTGNLTFCMTLRDYGPLVQSEIYGNTGGSASVLNVFEIVPIQ